MFILNSNLDNQVTIRSQNFDFSIEANKGANLLLNPIDVPGYTVSGIIGLMFWTSRVLLVGDYINSDGINIRLLNSYTSDISGTGVIRLLYVKN